MIEKKVVDMKKRSLEIKMNQKLKMFPAYLVSWGCETVEEVK